MASFLDNAKSQLQSRQYSKIDFSNQQMPEIQNSAKDGPTPALVVILADYNIWTRFFLVFSVFALAVARRMIIYSLTIVVILTCAESPKPCQLQHNDLANLLATRASFEDDSYGGEEPPAPGTILLDTNRSSGLRDRSLRYLFRLQALLIDLRRRPFKNSTLNLQTEVRHEKCITDSLFQTWLWLGTSRVTSLQHPRPGGGNFLFSAIDIYVTWVVGCEALTLFLNLIVNIFGLVICSLLTNGEIRDDKWEFYPFTADYIKAFPVITGVIRAFVGYALTSAMEWWIMSVLNRSRLSFPTTGEVITMCFSALYVCCREITAMIPIIVIHNVDNEAFSFARIREDNISHPLIRRQLLWLGLYFVLELPAAVYFIRSIAAHMDPDDTIVHTLRQNSSWEYSVQSTWIEITLKEFWNLPWADHMRSSDLKFWKRVYMMHVKMGLVLVLLSLVGYLWLLGIFGPLHVFDEVMAWVLRNYAYSEGGFWEALSNLIFWVRVDLARA